MADDENDPLYEAATAGDVSPDAVASGGRVAIVSPGGRAGTVDASEVPELLKQGWRLEGAGEHTERRREAEFGSSPIAAAGLGALSGITGGLSDVIAGGIGQVASGGAENAAGEISARNKGARTIGELGGLITGAGAAGLIDAAGARVGEAVGGGILGKTASGAVSGGLVGATQTVSRVGLSDDPMSSEAIAGDLARNVIFGGLAGGAGGAVGELASRGAKRAEQGLDDLAEELSAKAAAPGQRKALEEARQIEMDRLADEAKAARPALVDDLKSLRADQKPFREALATRLASAPAEVRADLVQAERSLAGVVGNARKFTQAPEKALDAVSNYGTQLRAALGTDPPQLAQGMLSRVDALQARLEKLAGPPSSGTLADLDAQLAKLPTGKGSVAAEGIAGTAKDVAKQAAGAAVYAGVHEVADDLNLPGAGMLAFLAGGRIGGKVADLLGAKLGARAAEVGSMVARAAARVSGAAGKAADVAFPRVAALLPTSFDDLRSSVLIAAADPAGTQARIDAAMNGVRMHDPALANQTGQIVQNAITHLAQVAPKSLGGPTLSDPQGGAISQLEKDKFLRRADVALDPGHLLAALSEGTLTPAQVATADAIYGHLMTELRGRLVQNMQGQPISQDRALVLSMLLGTPATAGLRPENIAASQARLAQEMQNAAKPPPPPSAQRVSQLEQPTRAQTFAGR